MKRGFPFSLLLVSAPRHPYQTTGERVFALIAANANASDEMVELFAGERGEIESGLVSTPAGDVPLRKVRLDYSDFGLSLETEADERSTSKEAGLAWEKRAGAEWAKQAGFLWLAQPNADWAVLSAETRPHRMD